MADEPTVPDDDATGGAETLPAGSTPVSAADPTLPAGTTPPTLTAAAIGGAAVRLAIGTTFGHYRIEAGLGQGGMGVVYRALDVRLERPVALKVMRPELAADPQFKERFLREAKTAASVLHPNVVTLFAAGEEHGCLYMAFEYVAGGDVDARIKRGGTLPVAVALRILAECAQGLEAIHEAGLVHRDIKPHNIFLDDKGRAKLGDLGLARQTGGDDRLTVTGIGLGTPAYMSPEQALGQADVDIRSDIHALGATLYAMLGGEAPFSGNSPFAVTNAVINGERPSIRSRNPAVGAAVEAVILRAMARDRAQRYPDPRALLDAVLALDELGTGVGGSSSQVPTLPPRASPAPPPPLPRRRPGRAVFAVAVVALAVGLALALAGRDRTPAVAVAAGGDGPAASGAGASSATVVPVAPDPAPEATTVAAQPAPAPETSPPVTTLDPEPDAAREAEGEAAAEAGRLAEAERRAAADAQRLAEAEGEAAADAQRLVAAEAERQAAAAQGPSVAPPAPSEDPAAGIDPAAGVRAALAAGDPDRALALFGGLEDPLARDAVVAPLEAAVLRLARREQQAERWRAVAAALGERPAGVEAAAVLDLLAAAGVAGPGLTRRLAAQSGTDLATVVEALPAHGRLVLAPGEYLLADGLELRRPMFLVAADEGVVLRCTGRHGVTLRSEGIVLAGIAIEAERERGPRAVLRIREGSPVLAGCRIAGGEDGIVVEGSRTAPTAVDLEIADCRERGLRFEGAGGRWLRGSVVRCGGPGVFIAASADPLIEAWSVSANRSHGVQTYNGGRGRLRDCALVANGGHGLLVMDGSRVALTGGEIADNAAGGVRVHDGSQLDLVAARLRANPVANGIAAEAGTLVLEACTVEGGPALGLEVRGGGRLEARSCTITGNAVAGVAVADGGRVLLERCGLIANGLGLRAERGARGEVHQPSVGGNRGGDWAIDPDARMRIVE